MFVSMYIYINFIRQYLVIFNLSSEICIYLKKKKCIIIVTAPYMVKIFSLSLNIITNNLRAFKSGLSNTQPKGNHFHDQYFPQILISLSFDQLHNFSVAILNLTYRPSANRVNFKVIKIYSSSSPMKRRKLNVLEKIDK